MSYLQFDKSQLVNLEYSLNKEILRTNRAGSFACTSIIGCNTRKYHGLLICPLEQFEGERHVLLSALDTTVVQHNEEFNLGIHKYQGDNYHPKGHKYIRDFEADVPKIVYRVGGVVLVQERILVEKEEQILIKFTLEEAHSPTRLRFRPFLAFRNMHSLSKANLYANTKVTKVENGIKTKLYQGYPNLFLQLNKKNEFIQVPDWYYNIEYIREMERGYDYKEDLFVPGYFEVPIKKGEPVIFSASTSETNPQSLKSKYTIEVSKRIPRDSFINCLINAAQQFIVKNKKNTDVIAGFPWFGSWSRDTFIALPGLTLAIDDLENCRGVLDSMTKKMKNGLFPNVSSREHPDYDSVDAPLWYIWAIQQYVDYSEQSLEVYKKYGKAIKSILGAYKEGTLYNIKMQDNGLVYAGENGKALTWMDAIVQGKPVTPRIGYAVEVNALWYNAICFTLELAGNAGDKNFVKQWEHVPGLIKESFIEKFWDDQKQYLADYVNNDEKDWAVRPNQVIATSLKYKMLTKEKQNAVLDIVKNELLTPRGLRSLSPKNENYKGVYQGNQEERDLIYHQGTVWPWLLEHFCRAYLDLYGKSGLSFVKKILNGFEEEMPEHGIGTVSEIYDGDPPHLPRGAISQAWSVGAILQINKMIVNFNNNNKKSQE